MNDVFLQDRLVHFHLCVCVLEVSLSSDFISGFCGETEEDHQQTLSLIREVGFNVGFLFSYSMRKVAAFFSVNANAPRRKQTRF